MGWHAILAEVSDVISTDFVRLKVAMSLAVPLMPMPIIFGGALVRFLVLCHHRCHRRSEFQLPARTDEEARNWNRRIDCCNCFLIFPCFQPKTAAADNTATLFL